MGIKDLNFEDIKDPKIFCEKALGINWNSTGSSWPPKLITLQAGTLTENFTFQSGQMSLPLSFGNKPNFPAENLNFETFLKYMYCYLRAFAASSKKTRTSDSNTALSEMLTRFDGAIDKMIAVKDITAPQKNSLRALRLRLDSLSRDLKKATSVPPDLAGDRDGTLSSKPVSKSESHNKKYKSSGLPPNRAAPAPPCVIRYHIKGTSDDDIGSITLPADYTLHHLVGSVCSSVPSSQITVTVGHNRLPLTTELRAISRDSIVEIAVVSTDKSNSALKSNPGSGSKRVKKKSDGISESEIQSKKTQPGKKKRISLAAVKPKTTPFENSFYGEPRSDSKIGSTVGARNAGISETGIEAGETTKTKNTTNQKLSGVVISPKIPGSGESDMKNEVLNAGKNSAVANRAIGRESDKKRRDGTPRKHKNNSGLGKSKKTQTGRRKKKGITGFKPTTSPFEASSAHAVWRRPGKRKSAGQKNTEQLSESEVEVADTQTAVADGLRRYYYTDNLSDGRHTIDMEVNATVKDMKIQLGNERNKDYKMIDILFAGKNLRDKLVIDTLEVGDADLFVYFRKEGDIPLGSCLALKVNGAQNNETEYEYEYQYTTDTEEEEEEHGGNTSRRPDRNNADDEHSVDSE